MCDGVAVNYGTKKKMHPRDYNETEVHIFFDGALARSANFSGPKYTPQMLERDANALGFIRDNSEENPSFKLNQPFINLNECIPEYFKEGIPPQEFAGPKFEQTKLFPIKALSMLVALGGTGKTSAGIAIGSYVAAGKIWAGTELEKRRVLFFSVEEDKLELDRKFCAVVEHWPIEERNIAASNFRLISLKGQDPRLTISDGKKLHSSGLATQIIKAAKSFDAKLIFLDHLQGLTSGDLNNSDTATVLSQVTNEIVSQTGAAVVVSAHTNKAHISATSIDHGFTTGSLAFENAARQVTGIIPLPDEDALKLGLQEHKSNYLKMEMPKNSYGTSREVSYLRKVYSEKFDTVSIEPLSIPFGSVFIETRQQSLQRKLCEYVKAHPYISKNELDKLAGKNKKPFNASKNELRKILRELIDLGAIKLHKPTKCERKKHAIPFQSTEVLIYEEL